MPIAAESAGVLFGAVLWIEDGLSLRGDVSMSCIEVAVPRISAISAIEAVSSALASSFDITSFSSDPTDFAIELDSPKLFS
jgi:hypothetical protein